MGSALSAFEDEIVKEYGLAFIPKMKAEEVNSVRDIHKIVKRIRKDRIGPRLRFPDGEEVTLECSVPLFSGQFFLF